MITLLLNKDGKNRNYSLIIEDNIQTPKMYHQRKNRELNNLASPYQSPQQRSRNKKTLQTSGYGLRNNHHLDP